MSITYNCFCRFLVTHLFILKKTQVEAQIHQETPIAPMSQNLSPLLHPWLRQRIYAEDRALGNSSLTKPTP